jgi:UDPglucose 6-dehydrogenase
VEAAFSELTQYVASRCLIVGKSTVPVGTVERIAELVVNMAPQAEVAWNPEFLREGFAIEDTLRPDRLVFGVRFAKARQVLYEVYRSIIDDDCPVVSTDLATAELAKVAANSFLATKISFINAVARVCEAAGADVTQLADAIGYDQCIGRRFLNAGLEFGGGCLPKGVCAFAARAEELGVDDSARILREVDAIKLCCHTCAMELVTELAGGSIAGKTVAVLGAAFKPNSDDIPDSPALAVASALHEAGARVTVSDPEAMENVRHTRPHLTCTSGVQKAATGADVVLLTTDWAEFRKFTPVSLENVVAHRRIVDARNILNPAAWRSAGWEFRALERP